MDSQVAHFGNPIWLVSVEAPHSELRVTARSQVSIVPRDGVASAALRWDRAELNRTPAVEFRLPSPRIPELAAIKALAREMGLREGDWDSLQRANRDLRLRLESLPGPTLASSTPHS